MAVDAKVIAKDRWDTLTIGVYRNDAESTNSELIEAFMDSVREILARMIHGVEGADEYSALCAAEEVLLSTLGDQATDLAEKVISAREAGELPMVERPPVPTMA